MAIQHSSHKGTGKRIAHCIKGKHAKLDSQQLCYYSSIDFIMKQQQCDLHPLKF